MAECKRRQFIIEGNQPRNIKTKRVVSSYHCCWSSWKIEKNYKKKSIKKLKFVKAYTIIFNSWLVVQNLRIVNRRTKTIPKLFGWRLSRAMWEWSEIEPNALFIAMRIIEKSAQLDWSREKPITIKCANESKVVNEFFSSTEIGLKIFNERIFQD